MFSELCVQNNQRLILFIQITASNLSIFEYLDSSILSLTNTLVLLIE